VHVDAYCMVHANLELMLFRTIQFFSDFFGEH
jgi:hypothetical protein